MSKELEIELKNNNIITIMVLKDIKEASRGNKVYDNKSNIVGVDITYPHDLNNFYRELWWRRVLSINTRDIVFKLDEKHHLLLIIQI